MSQIPEDVMQLAATLVDFTISNYERNHAANISRDAIALAILSDRSSRSIAETGEREPTPQTLSAGDECRYASDQEMPEHRCAARCVYEQNGFSSAIRLAAQVAERYDETDTLSAPKAIASAIRALATEGKTDEPCPGEHQAVLDAIQSHNSGEEE